MKLLPKFYADFQLKQEVHDYLLSYLKQVAIEKAFNGDTTDGIKEAKECIDSAFRNLESMYGEKKQKKPQSNR